MKEKLLPATNDGIRLAAAYLRSGRLVAFPTETVYGLGAVATWPDAVARVYRAKGRPPDNPLIWHFPDVTAIRGFVHLTDVGEALFETFSPGPLSVVLESWQAPATIACRIPQHEEALALLREVGRPLAAPSANRSGRPSPTRPEHVLEDLGDHVAAVLDGGTVRVGLESTVVDATGETVKILRPGAVTEEMLRSAGIPIAAVEDPEVLRRSPGTRHPHYRPRVPVVALSGVDREGVARWVVSQRGRVGVIAPFPLEGVLHVVYRDVEELAHTLYESFRNLERVVDVILVVGPERSGLGAAVWDRLERAAAGQVYDGGAIPKDVLGGTVS